MKNISHTSKRFINTFLALLLMLSITCSMPTTASAATTASACNKGSNYLGEFTFTGNNIGGNRTINGRKLRFCVAHKQVDNPYHYGMYVSLVRWDNVVVATVFLNSTTDTDANGYHFFVSDWYNVAYGVDYHLEYSSSTLGTGSDPRRINCHVWFDVEL